MMVLLGMMVSVVAPPSRKNERKRRRSLAKVLAASIALPPCFAAFFSANFAALRAALRFDFNSGLFSHCFFVPSGIMSSHVCRCALQSTEDDDVQRSASTLRLHTRAFDRWMELRVATLLGAYVGRYVHEGISGPGQRKIAECRCITPNGDCEQYSKCFTFMGLLSDFLVKCRLR